jgi:hypothetical protein
MNWLLWITILAVTPSLSASDPQPYPSVACTPQELTRLRNAYQRSGPDHEVVARRVEQADAALKAEVVFPPEGGQHNQWYQCVSSPAAVEESTAPAGQGFEYFDQVRRGETNGPIKATVAMRADQVLISLNDEPGSEVITGTGVGESVLDRVPVLVVSRRGGSARFAAAIELAPKGQVGEIAGVEIRDDESGGSLVRVLLRGQGEELYSYNPAGTLRTVGGIRTESKLLCLRRKNGQAYQELAEAK